MPDQPSLGARRSRLAKSSVLNATFSLIVLLGQVGSCAAAPVPPEWAELTRSGQALRSPSRAGADWVLDVASPPMFVDASVCI